jgi:hypothetical protein
MSEYQRYEFMTIDRPLTREQLDAVDSLSSHIEASSTHAVIEYSWDNFKHNPIKVLHEFFDAFLYWANWGSPELAFRFPHGILPADLIEGYDLEDFVTFTRYPDYDILDIHFAEMEAPDVWTDYELGSFISIRDELMEGDLRSLYIVWLAAQHISGTYDEEEDYEISVPPVPAGFGSLTAAQQALTELLRVPNELLAAASRHSNAAMPSSKQDVAALVKLLPPDRGYDYLVRLARNEPGLSRRFVRELRELSQDKTGERTPEGEHATYATLLAEGKAIKAQREREKREQERLARERHLREVHERQEEYWRQVDQAVIRANASGYDEATKALIDLRAAADQFKETQEFQERFRDWVRPHLRRPAFVKRLRDNKFALPEA